MPKRKVVLKVSGTAEMVEVMDRLRTLNLDLEADARPGSITVTLHGTKDEMKKYTKDLKEITGNSFKNRGPE